MVLVWIQYWTVDFILDGSISNLRYICNVFNEQHNEKNLFLLTQTTKVQINLPHLRKNALSQFIGLFLIMLSSLIPWSMTFRL